MRRINIGSILILIVSIAVYAVFGHTQSAKTDQTVPVISMAEDRISVSTGAETEELLAGITVTDGKDGDITDSLIIESLSNFLEPNVRSMTVAAFDSDGHVVKASRDVVYTDYQPTRFSLSAPFRFVVGTNNVLRHVTAADLLDGDLSDAIKMSGSYSMDSAEGDYHMEFYVTNSAGDVAWLPVTVTLYSPTNEALRPQIALSDYLVYTTAENPVKPWDYLESISIGRATYSKRGTTLRSGIYDSAGQELVIENSEVSITDYVDYSEPGVYEILYQYISGDYEMGSVRLIVIVEE